VAKTGCIYGLAGGRITGWIMARVRVGARGGTVLATSSGCMGKEIGGTLCGFGLHEYANQNPQSSASNQGPVCSMVLDYSEVVALQIMFCHWP